MADSFIAVVARRLSILVTLALVALACASAGAARAETVVSLTFDDGIASQYNIARPALRAHGMLGTFYVNSGTIGTYPYYMDWTQLDKVHADRNEIAGHTVSHRRLNDLTAREAHDEICNDATALRSRGYGIVSFAYPHGQGYTNPAVTGALAECGFASARTYGELRDDFDCTAASCPYAETIPPAAPYRVRTPGYKTAPYTLEDLEGWVTQAQDHGGGWVPIVFHDLDNSGGASTVTPDDFVHFLDWLQTSGAVVKTVRSVMGYPDPSPPSVPETPQPVHAFGSAAVDKFIAFASLKAKKRQDVDRIVVSAAMLEPGTLSATGTVSVSNASRVFKLERVSKEAKPSKRVKLRLRLSKKALRAAKRAIRAHRRVRARIRITATDRAGNKKTAKRTVSLRD